ncbi:hypothetical protein [Georgenia sp. MJ170]|uniref:hypothetical protein n=1 Tax=Georgenia sunbinii TaxID=3117728 RepID=UPI002F25F295
MNIVSTRIAYATGMIGARSLAGWCEKFVRQSFGFPARYSSALLAWSATKRRHSNVNEAPAGVPVFWRLHPANKNYGLGHVALSVGGGYCISTSVGPGGAIGKVRIADLTRAWGMTPLGWTEDYHGRTVWAPSSTSTDKENTGVSFTNKDASRHAENVVKQTTKNVGELIRQDTERSNRALHLAFREEVVAAAELVVGKLAEVPGLSGTDVERIRVAILGDKHPKTPNTDLRGVAVTTMQDTKALLALVQSLAGAWAATAGGGEAFDADKFAASVAAIEEAA